VFYFVTTDRFDQTKDGSGAAIARSRLHRLTFDDIRNPALGGKIDMLIDGTGPGQMFDNMTVDSDGNILLQEDPGNQGHGAKIWKFFPAKGELVLLAKADPARFGAREGGVLTPATAPFTVDEESSGIIEVTGLFLNGGKDDEEGKRGDDRDGKSPRWMKKDKRYYLGVVQAHYNRGDAELVEGGQLFLMGVPKTSR
jgi:hypothetical protein